MRDDGNRGVEVSGPWAEWVRQQRLSSVPARSRRTAALEELEGIEKVIERARAGRRHAPNRKAGEAIAAKLDRLEERAALLRSELGLGPVTFAEAETASRCNTCGKEAAREELDWGVCFFCQNPTIERPEGGIRV